MFRNKSAGLTALVATFLRVRSADKPRTAPAAPRSPNPAPIAPFVPGEMAYPVTHFMGLNR